MRSTKWLRKPTGSWVLVEVINGRQMPVGIGYIEPLTPEQGYSAQFFSGEGQMFFNTLDEAKTWMQTVWRMK